MLLKAIILINILLLSFEKEIILKSKYPNKITVRQISGYKARLKFEKYKIDVEARIGLNGLTKTPHEDSNATPIGTFKFGLAFGFRRFQVNNSLKYQIINKNLYWVSDIKSKYYNKLVDITKVPKGSFNTKKSEHLIDYPTVYEFAIEIMFNPQNDPRRGSAIFLHVMSKNKGGTAGCVAVERNVMMKLLKYINKDTVIEIK